MSYIMALDAGTTSNRCILFNEKGEMCSVAQKEFTQYFPKPGWVEHDADEIWTTQLGVARGGHEPGSEPARRTLRPSASPTSARPPSCGTRTPASPFTTPSSGSAAAPAPTATSCKAKGLTEKFRQKTGLVIDAYFSATKLKWILDNVPGAREKAEAGELLFGTVETWLIWKLTKRQGPCHGLFQRHPHHAVQHQHPAVGR